VLLSALGMNWAAINILCQAVTLILEAKRLWLFFQAVLMCNVKTAIIFKYLPTVERLSNFT